MIYMQKVKDNKSNDSIYILSDGVTIEGVDEKVER